MNIFKLPGEATSASVLDGYMRHVCLARIHRRLAALTEDAQEQIKERSFGKTGKGLDMTSFYGYVDSIANLYSELTEVAAVKVMPGSEWLRTSGVGEAVPLWFAGVESFMLILHAHLNVSACLELVSAVEAIINFCAAGRNADEACIVLGEELIFVSPLCYPNSSFEVMLMSRPLVDTSSDSE